MMLKGYQRKLIMMPTKGSPHFEAAYFILRKEAETKSPNANDMLYEATRILEETATSAKRPPIQRRHLAIALGIGTLLGALIVGMIWIAVA